MKTSASSHLHYSKSLPSLQSLGKDTILIYDRFFEDKPKIQKWIRDFERRHSVKSGEKLKNFDQLPGHLKKIIKLTEGLSTRDITLVVLGGGSVGDFGGFVASVLKRGVRLIHIPSTWLAAIDSAHGGKTGMNISKIKNQIGTFYPAEKIYLVQDLLETQPQERIFEALGEVIKISLIEGRELWQKLQKVPSVDSSLYWKTLRALIAAKYRVVQQDPLEKKGLRHALNLGHTMGHVWESQIKIPHGLAVLYGTAFAVEWSLARKHMASKDYYNIRLSELGSLLPDRLDLKRIIRQTKNPTRFLMQDKKISTHKKIRFVFLKTPGKVLIEEVALDELIDEMRRQAK